SAGLVFGVRQHPVVECTDIGGIPIRLSVNDAHDGSGSGVVTGGGGNSLKLEVSVGGQVVVVIDGDSRLRVRRDSQDRDDDQTEDQTLDYLGAISVVLRASVVELVQRRFTTEAQSNTEITQSRFHWRPHLSPAGKTSYSGCTGLSTQGSSATVMARIRMRSFSGSESVFAPGGRSIA